MSHDDGNTEQPGHHGLRKRVGPLAAVAAIIVVGVVALKDVITLANLASQESQLRDMLQAHPILAFAAAFGIYVVVAGLSLPGATVLTLSYGWLFGFTRALVLVSFASTAGATLAFLLSRYLFRDSVQRRFGDRLARFNESLARDGAYFLFSLRLIPVVPFFVINAVMGLTPLRTTTFWWASQLGMLPGTAVYVYAGSSVPSLQRLADDGISTVFSGQQLAQLLSAFALLGVFPLLVRWGLRRFGAKSQEATKEYDAHAS